MPGALIPLVFIYPNYPLNNRLKRYNSTNTFPTHNQPMTDLSSCNRYMITGYFATRADLFDRVHRALAQGVRLIQFRAPWLEQNAYLQMAQALSNSIRALDAVLIIKGDYSLLRHRWCQGLHLTSDQLTGTRPQKHHAGQLLIGSCHSIEEIRQAQAMSADFITLSPVRPTPSHPNARPLGLSRAAELTGEAAMPTFWLGGMTIADITVAQTHGARGIAAITAFWSQ